jgi:uncharacterized membrane protein YhaH (DUF805 family)
MNPFTGSLNRLGFLIWSLIPWVFMIANAIVIEVTKKDHQGNYWLGYRVLVVSIFIGVSLFATVRRLENAGLNKWLALLSIVPFVGLVFWVALLFIPPKRHKA